MAGRMNLAGGTKSFYIPVDLCDRIQHLLEGNWCEEVTRTVGHSGDGKLTRALFAVGDRPVFQLTAPVGSNSLIVSKTILSQKGKGTYTELFRVLMSATDAADAKLVIPCVNNPKLAEWCRQNGFTKSLEDDSYFHVKL